MNACEDMFARFKNKPYVRLIIGGAILSTLIFLSPSLYGEGYHAINLAPNLIAEDGSIGMRITQEPFSKELCYRFQKVLVSTSANISGEPAAQNYCDIDPRIIEAVDYVCWSRRQEHKPHRPSSIIRLKENGEVTIIRK